MRSTSIIDAAAFHSVLDKAFGFVGFDKSLKGHNNVKLINGAPHQSLKARFPGITHAASDLGVTRAHLWAVLSGHRKSPPLLARWNAWLKRHPEFATLQRKAS